MRDLAVLLLMAGVLLVVHAVYEERARIDRGNPKVVYKFIPRDIYYDQFFERKYDAYIKDLEIEGAAAEPPLPIEAVEPPAPYARS